MYVFFLERRIISDTSRQPSSGKIHSIYPENDQKTSAAPREHKNSNTVSWREVDHVVWSESLHIPLLILTTRVEKPPI